MTQIARRSSRRRWLLAACLGLACLGGADPPDPESVERGRAMLAEGDALADRGATSEALLQYNAAYEVLLPALRRLPFRHEVDRDVTPRDQLGQFVREEIEREMTPGEFRASEAGLKALGFFPAELDLKQVMIDVYAAEIAAFYDPRTRKMHLIDEPEAPAEKPSFLQRLLGSGEGFDKDENKTVIAHELTHALADQHFDLKALQDAIDSDDDRSLALSALIEGEATLAMLGAQMDDWTGAEVTELPAEELGQAFRLMGQFLPMFGGSSLRNAPPLIKESLLFPYVQGLVFVADLTNRAGWAAVDQAYRSPPQSTEQVLHPEKYRTAPDPPQAIDLGTLDPGPGWTELGRNVVGEMQLAVLLRWRGGRAAAAGWDGDQYAVLEAPGGRLGLVWAATWDTEADAVEFARGYARFQTAKLGPDIEEPAEAPERLQRTSADGRVFLVERRGVDTVVVEGFDPEATQRLATSGFSARKTEKRAPIVLPAPEAPAAVEPEPAPARVPVEPPVLPAAPVPTPTTPAVGGR